MVISGDGEEAEKRTLRDDGSSTQMQLKQADRHEIRPTVFAFFFRSLSLIIL